MGDLSRAMAVVFVDDEDAILSSLKSLLRRQGYTMWFFVRAADALEFLKTNSADLIVSDLRMPGMTGIELLNRSADLLPDAVRVILSGYEDKSVVLNALSKGLAHHYVLKPWDDAALKSLFAQIAAKQESVRKQQLESIIGSIHALPSPPRLHLQLQAALAKDTNSIDTIVREIEKNPPIVAKMLRVANSVYYAARKSITNVRDAVIFIGTDFVTGLITAMEAFQNLGEGVEKDMEEIIENMWKDAVRRATLAKWVAINTPGFAAPHIAYTASLLQDIGYAVRCTAQGEKYRKYMELCAQPGANPYEIEGQVFGITHEDVGAALLNYWNFPKEILTAITLHHRKVGDDTLARILQTAEMLAEGVPSPLPHDSAVIERLPAWQENLKKAISSNQMSRAS